MGEALWRVRYAALRVLRKLFLAQSYQDLSKMKKMLRAVGVAGSVNRALCGYRGFTCH